MGINLSGFNNEFSKFGNENNDMFESSSIKTQELDTTIIENIDDIYSNSNNVCEQDITDVSTAVTSGAANVIVGMSNNNQNSSSRTISLKKLLDLINQLLNDAVDSIRDFFDRNIFAKKEAVEILKQVGLTNVDTDDISDIQKRGINSENVLITLSNGDEYLFTPYLDDYILNSVTLSDGTIIKLNIGQVEQQNIRDIEDIHRDIEIRGKAIINVNGCDIPLYWLEDDGKTLQDFIEFVSTCQNIKLNLSQTEQQNIRDIADIRRDVEVRGRTVINVNGCNIPLYWLEDDEKSLQDFIEFVSTCQKGLEGFSPEAIKCANYAGFLGFFYGPLDCCDTNFSSYDMGSVIAYALGSKFVVYSYYRQDSTTISHEFAHIIDSSLNGRVRRDKEFLSLYEENRKSIQVLLKDITGYGNSTIFPDGVPTVAEFFACVVSLQMHFPEDLQALFPEVYDYVVEFLHNID